MNDGGSQTDGATAQEGLRFLHRADNGTQLSCLEIMLTHIPFFPNYGHLKKIMPACAMRSPRADSLIACEKPHGVAISEVYPARKSICVISAFFLS